jgi:hypothetical protein
MTSNAIDQTVYNSNYAKIDVSKYESLMNEGHVMGAPVSKLGFQVGLLALYGWVNMYGTNEFTYAMGLKMIEMGYARLTACSTSQFTLEITEAGRAAGQPIIEYLEERNGRPYNRGAAN